MVLEPAGGVVRISLRIPFGAKPCFLRLGAEQKTWFQNSLNIVSHIVFITVSFGMAGSQQPARVPRPRPARRRREPLRHPQHERESGGR